MYKTLSLFDNADEMLVMLNSLPLCSIVFDLNLKLVDVNFRAEKLLGIDNKKKYIENKMVLNIDYECLRELVNRLKNGFEIYQEKLSLRTINGKNIRVECYGNMLYGTKKVFLFQFHELPPASATSSIYQETTRIESELEVPILKKKKSYPEINKIARTLFLDLLSEGDTSVLQFSWEYQNLNQVEVVTSRLISIDKSVVEISNLLKTSPPAIYKILKNIRLKLNLDSNQELKLRLKWIDHRL